MDENAPVFVKVEDYKDLLDILSLTKERLKQAQDLLERIKQLDKEEEAELETWTKDIDDAKELVANLDKTLLGTGAE